MKSYAFQALVFDLDGTLVDSRQDLANAVNHALRVTGLPERPADEIVTYVGNGMKVLVSSAMGRVSGEVLEAGIQAFKVHYAEHCLDSTTLYPGVAETLEELSENCRLTVVTNKPAGFSEQILRSLGIRPFFSVVVGGDSLPERKPHPMPVLKSLESLGVPATSGLMIGDGEPDILAGRAAGLKTCLVTYGFGFSAEIAALKPDFQIARFKDIKEIVK